MFSVVTPQSAAAMLTSGAASAVPLVSNMQFDAIHAQNKAGDGTRSLASGARLIAALPYFPSRGPRINSQRHSGEVAIPGIKRVILSHCPTSFAQKVKKP